jgi:hypothetical protein
MGDFFETAMTAYEEVRQISPSALGGLLKFVARCSYYARAALEPASVIS